MSDLRINNRNERGVNVLDLSGPIALGESNRKLHNAIRDLLADRQNNILLNLENVTLIDSSGLGEMVAAYASTERNGGVLKLFGLSDRFIELMTMTKLYTVFEVFDTEAEALSSFAIAKEAGVN
ncbi:MAG: anti-sigma factor antagonist [Blastocatellia bacterium]